MVVTRSQGPASNPELSSVTMNPAEQSNDSPPPPTTPDEAEQILRNRIAELEAALDAALGETPPPPPHRSVSPPPPVTSQSKDPKLGEPGTFDGNPSEFDTFFSYIQLYLSLKPQMFPSDKSCVLYFISRLRKNPAEWGQNLISTDSPLLI